MKNETRASTTTNMENIGKYIDELASRDLKIRIKAKGDAQNAVNADPSVANLAALEKATKMLDDFLAPKKIPDREPAFDNRLEAHKYLKRLGYKIGKSKFYQDCKAGLCRMQGDGSVLESDLKAYVSRAGLVKPDQAAYEIESSDLARKKQKREVEKLTAQIERMTIELDVLKKNLLDRNQVETEQAIKAGALMAGLNHVFRNFARDAINLVGGDLKHTQALSNFWTAKAEDLFDEFAHMEKIEVDLKN